MSSKRVVEKLSKDVFNADYAMLYARGMRLEPLVCGR
jgi:hypothetical protein